MHADMERALDDVDDATAALIIKLQIEDAREFAAQQAAAGNYHALDDVVAREAYEVELKRYRGTRGLTILETPDLVDEIAATIRTDTEIESHARQQPAKFQCGACNDYWTADECYKVVECEHYYCDDCLADLFKGATTDESLYPPRCCGYTIPYEDISGFLPRKLRAQFEEKKEELDDTDRLYCRVPTCSAYIAKTSRTADVGVCAKCTAETCVHCKNKSHEGGCEEDQALQATLTLATEEGWKKCPACDRMIELTTGCNHMTCICRAQFCYICRAVWKTCTCPQWDERRLLARAQNIADRENGGAANAEQVARAAGLLRDRHECDHRPRYAWLRVNGEHRCEECGDTMPSFIFRCPQCYIQACRRCKNNRL